MGGLREQRKVMQLRRHQETHHNMVEGLRRAVMILPVGKFDTGGNMIHGVSPSGEHLDGLE